MDLLSDVLRDLRLESVVLSTSELRAPWGFDKGAVRGAAPFHVVVEGRCLVEVEGAAPIDLALGDLVVLPHGHRHALSSEQGVPRVPFAQVLKENGIRSSWTPGMRLEELNRIRFGGHGSLTRTITGLFAFRDRRSNPLLDALPAIIYVRGKMGQGPAWLQNSLSLLVDEALSGRPGFQTVTERVADTVFVQAVRDYLESKPGSDAGWLRGLADPQIARALALVHGRPGDAWTVGSLAKAAGLSRTVLAHRFRALVGASVMEYVTVRRMHSAAGMLADSKDALSAIANQVGYESEISFNKAFRRWAGLPPGQYRRRMKEPASVGR
ncbi:MAG: AraC family transcriptional regulator [Dongiaceae bacterium]